MRKKKMLKSMSNELHKELTFLQGKLWYRFRCHTKSLLDVIKYWKEEPRYYEACKKEAEKDGFGGLLEFRLANVHENLFDSFMP
ncbi:unnamed protein product [Linum trigynum]|uniref:Uncharacterized protein n=1 Tax=Linum trigynum TaxID=586398 RepID=A0AAV2ERR4_9ROSI